MKYKGVIWTHHILQRMKERDLSLEDVYWVFRKPDKSEKASTPGAWKHYRKHNNTTLAVVAKKNEKGEWVMMSCWTKGANYRKLTRKHKNFWRLLWEMLTGK